MGIRSTLSSLLSAPLAAVLETRIRELASRILDEHDLAEPAEVRELASKVDHARRAVDDLRSEVASLREALESVREEVEGSEQDDLALRVAGIAAKDDALAAALDTLRSRFDQLGKELVALRRKEPAAPAPAAPKAAAPAAAPAGDRGCKVPDCDGAHRARGFCGRHYQMWKRGTLPGFISPDGTVGFDGDERQWRIAGKEFVGAAATLSRGKVRVEGAQVAATRVDA
ncbi:MAG: hypothetical protein H6732_13905 [Alphaproteobacteria bacterium]|nr:hypothetical protein [Alphaproteobacteria bacterium]